MAIGFGVVLTFFGLKLVRPSIFIIGLLTGTIAGVVMYYALYSSSISVDDTFWYYLGGGAGAGLIIGTLLACFAKIGASIAGGFGGFCLGALLYDVALKTTD